MNEENDFIVTISVMVDHFFYFNSISMAKSLSSNSGYSDVGSTENVHSDTMGSIRDGDGGDG
ncbi:unnamed protein product [Thelazia callipaeda]|uniref:Spore germination protein n=1 Tax=Thelazia callipaeda TaxID=103827 RepID=A0A0N5CT27_THECL|nr:unnamed protein product [Thelazia callipaeda]